MAIYSADNIYFDEAFDFNAGKNWDIDPETIIYIDAVVDFKDTFVLHEILTITIEADIEVIESKVNHVDLMKLVPSKFHQSQLLQEFFDEAGNHVGRWLGAIDDILKLLDPYSVGDPYIGFLAELLGWEFSSADLPLEERRLQLLSAIDFYKMKGTYKIYDLITRNTGLTVGVTDLYTNDYQTFIPQPWYANKEGINPEGLDSSYYKSPHFGVILHLDKLYVTEGGSIYLFKPNVLDPVRESINLVRPVNSVPRYSLAVNALTTEIGGYLILPTQIKTSITDQWIRRKIYFDTAGVLFDDDYYFDQEDDSIAESIYKWKIGTGNKGNAPNSPSFALDNIVLEGTSLTTRLLPDSVEVDITIDGAAIQGISELGLYNAVDKPIIFSTFPDIDLTPNESLTITVTIMAGRRYVDWDFAGGDRTGREYELYLDEKIQKEYHNLYDITYNRLTLTAKSMYRWDAFDIDWDIASTSQFEWDYPKQPGEYAWYNYTQYFDAKTIKEDNAILYSQASKEIKSPYLFYYAMIRTNTTKNFKGIPFEIYEPIPRTYRYFQMAGFFYVMELYPTYIYYNNPMAGLQLK